MTNKLIEERMKNMEPDEVPNVWRIADLTDDELVNTDAILQNWLVELERMKKEEV
jgi:hypothetical protein